MKMLRKKYSNSRPHIPNLIQQEVRIEARFACVVCKNEAAIELAHIDGDRNNNYADNLVVLCPNHHTLYDSGKIQRTEIERLKSQVREENDILSKIKQQLEYLQNSAQISISGDYAKIKTKYQNLLNDYSDKLIFYQCFIYLIPEFYIDNRGIQTREIVREFLNISIEEEQQILSHLQRLELTVVVGGLLSLKNAADAKVALNELISKNNINLSQLLEKFAEL
ncbi:MAG: HNH endonuclease signature motif containing protein [Patescibacteria group bacterium]